MLPLLVQWLLSAVSLAILSRLLPGFRIKNFGTAVVVAAVYGILHLLLFRILAIITFIPRVLTFGLFDLVINAFLLFLTDKILEDFKIDTLLTTFIAAILLTILNNLWQWLLF
jgi:putative membrane protein